MSNDLLQALYDLATNPGSGIVALTWLVMANTVVGVLIALLRREFSWDKFLNFLGGERVVIGGIVLALIYAGFYAGLPLLPFYQFVSASIALSAGADLISKLGTYFAKKE